MNVAGLLLAAGAASRYGSPKMLERFDGRTLLDRALDALLDGGCDPVVVVLGAHAASVRQAVSDRPDRIATVENPLWSTGMASSLRAGLDALPERADAVVVALADQPLVGAPVVRRLAEAGRSGARAAVATYDGRPRNPVLLARSVFADVAATVTGDRGARDWLRAHPDLVLAVACDDAGDPFDVDTPQDLARLVRNSGRERAMSSSDNDVAVGREGDPARVRREDATHEA